MSNRSSERWSRLSFMVHRNSNGTSDWALVHQLARGGRRWDRRVAWGRIETPPGSPASQDALEALGAALKAATERAGGHVDVSGTPPPEASAPPGGPRGDTACPLDRPR